MKILIIARYFAPTNQIGAIRPTKMAKYLARMGHQVTVYAGEFEGDVRDELLEKDAGELKRVFRLIHGRIYARLHDFLAKRDPSRGGRRSTPAKNSAGNAAGPEKGKSPSASRLDGKPSKRMMTVYRVMWWWQDWDYYRNYRRSIPDRERYDVIFSTWNTNCAHNIALDLMRRGRAARYVADFRDPVTTPFPLFQKALVRRFCKRVYRRADAVTLASMDYLTHPELVRQPVFQLTNGFDPEDLEELTPFDFERKGLRLLYCGDLYNGRRDLRPLMRILKTCVEEGTMKADGILLAYAGFASEAFSAQAAECGVEDMTVDYGYVPRIQALKMELGADILVMANLHDPSKPNSLPGKLFEYLMMRKPLISLISGKAPGCPQEKLIAEGRFGCCCTQTGGEGELRRLREYLQEQYDRHTAGQELLYQGEEAQRVSFACPVLARRLESILGGEEQA